MDKKVVNALSAIALLGIPLSGEAVSERFGAYGPASSMADFIMKMAIPRSASLQ